MQGTLFPLKVRSIRRVHLGTADLRELASTHDGQDYAVKSTDVHPLLPASEMLCYRIGEACQLAVPYSAMLDMLDGSKAFGSRWEYGVSQWKDFAAPADKKVALDEASDSLSGILALDLFVGNVDRHLNNFLFRRNHAGAWTALAFDYSRALFVNGFPASPLPGAGCATMTVIAILKSMGIWRGPSAVFAVSELHGIRRAAIEHWLSNVPPEWLDATTRDGVLNWWDSGELNLRIQGTLKLL